MRTPRATTALFTVEAPLARAALLTVLVALLGCAERGMEPPIIESVVLPTANIDAAKEPDDLLRIATANLWGVSVLGFDWADEIDARFAAFATRLARNEPDLDVVLIQEAWKDRARRALLDDPRVARRFPFRVDVVASPGGAGLVILSRHPVEEAVFHRFKAQGNCFKFWEGDCFGGKGLLAARLNVRGRSLWVGTTHLIACYAPKGAPETTCDEDDANHATRAAQILEARGVFESLVGEEPALLGGDFNFTRTSRHYPAMTAATLGRGWSEPGDVATTPGRIDYLFVRPGDVLAWQAQTVMRPIFTERVEIRTGESIPLSDHAILGGAFCLRRVNGGEGRCLSLSSP
jgi:endonuclease/exonuclease/phosphatase family metal-dependent hydrolase